MPIGRRSGRRFKGGLKNESYISSHPSRSVPTGKKPELKELASRISGELKEDYSVQYDEAGSIGKRYRRLDEAGTPFCVTVDFDGLENETVTVRHRDTMTQERVSVSQLNRYIVDQMNSWQTPED